MIPDFSKDDIFVVSHYIGKILIALGLVQLFPVFVGFIFREIGPIIDFFISILACFSFGSILLYFSPSPKGLNWRQGMIIVALSWLLAMCFSALPLYLSGHFECFLDACFESMSAYATTGLVLIQDLDHLSHAHNIWRHQMCFIGGQGIILVALVFFFRGGDALRIYIGEARDDKILPNSITTAKFIWMVSFTYLIIGSLLLAFVLILHGIPFSRALFHGLCIFMAGWDTAGFAPQSLNVLYYHSPAFELVTIIIFLLGATSFGVHYSVWTGKFRELREDFEVKILLFSIFFAYLITLVGFLGQTAVFYDAFSFFRHTFYQVISAHTGVGYSNIYVSQLKGWSEMAIFGVIIAMAIGGCINSTAGGIKVFRIGLFYKALKREVRRLAYPESSRVKEFFHHQREIPIDDTMVKTAMIITVCYVLLYISGAVVGAFFGYDFLSSFFESVSAAANVGLSIGITSPSMPAFLKFWYIIEMWAGRLEFFAIFILIRFFVKIIKK
ncbi:MAG: TrkH family potassium uptake protein [Candidatus Omnitrophica bacterium]|nr:TrkH family potassium uptake protein [Candidatus Omnitrophota bacterium]MCM8825846.1 TrkH family potassium uptake protein [Candidatus Omnitrophota bacterium]